MFSETFTSSLTSLNFTCCFSYTLCQENRRKEVSVLKVKHGSTGDQLLQTSSIDETQRPSVLLQVM